MNLMKYFNFNYMIQNLKKSKSILALFLGILPIISILYYIVIIQNGGYDLLTLENISLIHYFGIYIIPIVLSACLFGFVYKKKSVDFINSMPLSRKTIMTTNSIAGIILLILMVVLSGFGIYISSLLLKVIMPVRMLFDYILVWSISYIFVFILSNLAMTISGNLITQIVVTILLLFFVPFLTDYIKTGNSYYDYDQKNLVINSTIDEVEIMSRYRIENKANLNYTIPYNNIRNLISGDNYSLYNTVSLVKMVIISVFGYIIGKYLFIKRKMEDNEISFRSLKVHNLIKALTLFPIIAFISLAVPIDNISIMLVIFILIFLLIYFFIYDLITRKTISNIKKSLIHFCVIISILFSFCIIIHLVIHDNRVTNFSISEKDITEIDFSLNTIAFSEFEHVSIKDNKVISDIIKSINTSSNDSSSSIIKKEIFIKTKNNNYKITGNMVKDDYDVIVNEIKKLNNIKNVTKLFDENKVYVIGFKIPNIQDYTNDSKVIKEAQKVIENNSISQKEYKLNQSLTLYAYDNGKVVSYKVDSSSSGILSNYVEKVIKNKNKNFLDRINNMSYTNVDYMISFTIYDHNIETSFMNNIQMNKENIYSFIKKYSNDNFDVTKDYVSLLIFLDNKDYLYFTNRVDEFLNAVSVEKDD